MRKVNLASIKDFKVLTKVDQMLLEKALKVSSEHYSQRKCKEEVVVVLESKVVPDACKKIKSATILSTKIMPVEDKLQ